MISIDFRWFSMISDDFSMIFGDFRGFSRIFRWFFDDFRWFSMIFQAPKPTPHGKEGTRPRPMADSLSTIIPLQMELSKVDPQRMMGFLYFQLAWTGPSKGRNAHHNSTFSTMPPVSSLHVSLAPGAAACCESPCHQRKPLPWHATLPHHKAMTTHAWWWSKKGRLIKNYSDLTTRELDHFL